MTFFSLWWSELTLAHVCVCLCTVPLRFRPNPGKYLSMGKIRDTQIAFNFQLEFLNFFPTIYKTKPKAKYFYFEPKDMFVCKATSRHQA